MPVAQKLIDDLQNPASDINQSAGAPDPTADNHDSGIPALWFKFFLNLDLIFKN